ncbi:MAG: hypothetical protein ABRQ26_07440 [Syntrophomonadaceae bacterium]
MILPEYLKDKNPCEMSVIERVIYYSCEAHSNYELAMKYLDPELIEQAQQQLYEMLMVVQKVDRMVKDPEQQSILQELEKVLKLDYSQFE